MAATLLSQLESSVASVQREAAGLDGGPLTDNCESVSDFCLLLERVMNFQSKNKTSVLGDRRDYWAFFLAALEKSPSVMPMIKRIQSSSDNRTTLGKGRSFIRSCLHGKFLGAVLQVGDKEEDMAPKWKGEDREDREN